MTQYCSYLFIHPKLDELIHQSRGYKISIDHNWEDDQCMLLYNPEAGLLAEVAMIHNKTQSN